MKLWITRDRKDSPYEAWREGKKPVYGYDYGEGECWWKLGGSLFPFCQRDFEVIFPKAFHMKGGPRSIKQIEVRLVKK